MDAKKEALILAGLSAVALFLSLGGIAAVFLGRMGFTLDAIFIILVCLTTTGLFGFMLLWQLHSAGLIPFPKKGKGDPGAGEGK